MFVRDPVCAAPSTTAVRSSTAMVIWYRDMVNCSLRAHREQMVERPAKICWRPNWESGHLAYLRCYSFWYSSAVVSDRWRAIWRKCQTDFPTILTMTRCPTTQPPRHKSMTPRPWTRWKSSAHVLRPVAPSRFAKQELNQSTNQFQINQSTNHYESQIDLWLWSSRFV